MVVPNYNFLLFITDTRKYILSCQKSGYDTERWYYNNCFFMYYNMRGRQICINPIYNKFMTINELKKHFNELHTEPNYFDDWRFEYFRDNIF